MWQTVISAWKSNCIRILIIWSNFGWWNLGFKKIWVTQKNEQKENFQCNLKNFNLHVLYQPLIGYLIVWKENLKRLSKLYWSKVEQWFLSVFSQHWLQGLWGPRELRDLFFDRLPAKKWVQRGARTRKCNVQVRGTSDCQGLD